MRKAALLWASLFLPPATLAGFGDPDESSKTPLTVPVTRPAMKQALEDLKDRKPRIPLPELTNDDIDILGERAGSYEARLRYHYFPRNESRGGGLGFGRSSDPKMTLDYVFKTELFWIVSRVNNCHY